MKQFRFNRREGYRHYDVKKNNDFVYELMNEVVFPKVTLAMPPVSVAQRAYRGFFPISKEGKSSVLQGLDELGELKKQAEQADKEPADGGRKSNNTVVFAQITEALMKIEEGMIKDMCDFLWSKLRPKANKLHKAVLSVNYITSIKYAAAYFRSKGIKYITISGTNERGETTGPEVRAEAIERFQTLDDVRVCIMITQTGAFGISLHDTSPNSTDDMSTWRKRWMVISPSYYMTAIHQAIGRIFRTGQRSVGECYIFYPNIAYKAEEQPILLDRILESLNRKSKVTSQAIYYHNRGLIKFPGDHPRYVKPGWGKKRDMPGGYIDEGKAKVPFLDKDGQEVTIIVEKKIKTPDGKLVNVLDDDGEPIHEQVTKMTEIETGPLLLKIKNRAEGFEDPEEWFMDIPPDANEQPNWKEIEARENLDKELKAASKTSSSAAASSSKASASKPASSRRR